MGGSTGRAPRRGGAAAATASESARTSCSTRARILASGAHEPSGALLLRTENGFAMTWAESLAQGGALRFFAIDAQGNPRTPSAEIADRADRPTPLALRRQDDGYVVVWEETHGGKTVRKERRIDERGRPRGDVYVSSFAGEPEPDPTCTATNGGQHCKTARGPDLELPATISVMAARSDADAAAVIGGNDEGLRLFVLACSAREEGERGGGAASAPSR
jgi:hypothetical protein